MKPPLLQLDNLDDRREVHHLLSKLPPRDRVRFVGWCCAKVAAANGNGPKPVYARDLIDLAGRCDRADLWLTNTCFADLVVLSSQWKLDLVKAAVELERRVRKPGT